MPKPPQDSVKPSTNSPKPAAPKLSPYQKALRKVVEAVLEHAENLVKKRRVN